MLKLSFIIDGRSTMEHRIFFCHARDILIRVTVMQTTDVVTEMIHDRLPIPQQGILLDCGRSK